MALDVNPQVLAGISTSPFQRSFENEQRSLQEKQANLALEGQKLQLDQARKAIDDREGFQRDMSAFLGQGGGDLKQLQQLRIRYPEQVGAIDSIMKAQGPDFQKVQFRKNSEVYSLFNAGREDLIQQRLEADVQAAQNTKDPVQIGAAQKELEYFNNSPEAYKKNVMLRLDSLTDGKFSAGEKAFAETEKVGAETTTEALTQQSKQLDNRKKMIENRYTQETDPTRKAQLRADLEKTNTEIDNIKSQIAERGAKTGEKAAGKLEDLEAKLTTTQVSLDTIDTALSTADDVIRAATGPVDQIFPTLQSDVADFENTIETIKSQQFIQAINSTAIKGSLSDAEGKRLSTAVASLELRGSPERLKKNLGVIKSLLEKAKTNYKAKLLKQTKPTGKATTAGRFKVEEL